MLRDPAIGARTARGIFDVAKLRNKIEALEKAGVKWRPYRTVASWYLWETLNRKSAASTK